MKNDINENKALSQTSVSGSAVIDALISQSNAIIDKATDLCLLEVEKIARKELNRKNKLNEFVMCMGTYFFNEVKTDQKGHNQISNYESKELDAFMDKYQDLKLTGFAMRFTAKGDVVTDW